MRIQLVNGDFWALDGEPENFATPEDVIAEVDEFLANTKEAGLSYSPEDVEVILDSSEIVTFPQFLTLHPRG